LQTSNKVDVVYFSLSREEEVAGFSGYEGAIVDTIWFGPDGEYDNAVVETGGVWLMVL